MIPSLNIAFFSKRLSQKSDIIFVLFVFVSYNLPLNKPLLKV